MAQHSITQPTYPTYHREDLFAELQSYLDLYKQYSNGDTTIKITTPRPYLVSLLLLYKITKSKKRGIPFKPIILTYDAFSFNRIGDIMEEMIQRKMPGSIHFIFAHPSFNTDGYYHYMAAELNYDIRENEFTFYVMDSIGHGIDGSDLALFNQLFKNRNRDVRLTCVSNDKRLQCSYSSCYIYSIRLLGQLKFINSNYFKEKSTESRAYLNKCIQDEEEDNKLHNEDATCIDIQGSVNRGFFVYKTPDNLLCVPGMAILQQSIKTLKQLDAKNPGLIVSKNPNKFKSNDGKTQLMNQLKQSTVYCATAKGYRDMNLFTHKKGAHYLEKTIEMIQGMTGEEINKAIRNIDFSCHEQEREICEYGPLDRITPAEFIEKYVIVKNADLDLTDPAPTLNLNLNLDALGGSLHNMNMHEMHSIRGHDAEERKEEPVLNPEISQQRARII